MNPPNQPPEEEVGGKFVSAEAMGKNRQQIDIVRTVMMIVGGTMTGIVACVGYQGFIAFTLLYLATTVAIGVKMNFNFKAYTNSSFVMFAISDVSKHAMSFLLFWTLCYALVYVY